MPDGIIVDDSFFDLKISSKKDAFHSKKILIIASFL